MPWIAGRPPLRTVLVLGLLTALGPLSIDLYLPAFPALQRDLRAGDGMVQLTLTAMTVGLALGQLLTGVLSDRWGRRMPLLVSTGLHATATAACAVAPSIGLLSTARFCQGVGAAGSSVIVLATVRDIAEGRKLVVLLSRVTVVTTTAPLLAPVTGAELLSAAGWRGIFGALAAASAALLLAAAATIPETHGRAAPTARMSQRFRMVWAVPEFRRATLTGSMIYAGVYAYVAASPLLLQKVYSLTPRMYAVIFLLNSLGLVAGVQLSSVLTRRKSTSRVLLGFTVAAATAVLAIVPLERSPAGIVGLCVCLFFFVAACGGCFPCAAAFALGRQGGRSGTATSLYGFATFTTAGLVAPVAGLIGARSPLPVAAVLLTTALIALGGAYSIARLESAPCA